MNYKDCIEWLNSFEKFGIKLGLDRIEYICNNLGNPQDFYKIVHVGGTNGKGSVCRFLESVLVNNGFIVGTYTSPHLQRFSERFVVNKKEISKNEIVNLVARLKPIIDKMMEEKNIPTYFEIVTAMVFLYFKEKNVDIAIIEVGLGGRFDATNIVNPMVTIITNVTLEHQKILGDKINDIALEKAGIIKEDIPIVTAAKGEAFKVIEKIAQEKDSKLFIIYNDSWRIINKKLDFWEYNVNGSLKEYCIKTSMIGKHQGENIAITISAIESLQMNGIYISDESIDDAFLNTKNPGRMEIVGINPLFLLDGAHNIAAMKYLRSTLEDDFSYDKLILIIGILSDKNIQEILDIISPIADIIIVTKSQIKRAFDPRLLKEMVKDKEVVLKDRVDEAIIYAKQIANKSDIVCVTGSLYTVGEARDYIFKN
jgi:dihydrofolate synthase/folylpolyglutamate synthase